MAVNKVVYNGTVLIDLTDSTITPATLAEGVIAYNSKGERIVGTMKQSTIIVMYDGSGNLAVNGMTVTDDGNGNVAVTGATATYTDGLATIGG